ncbi:unnamed protein product [Allacma fusca]|uniref:J domain-containing protein n=1 Tax=Allacma fusca TaxID=39272 RepID=A0A8J2JJ85_9HEXA|nr:unnamed protein product [Allacma fusca]
MELWTIPGIYGHRRLSREGKSFYKELSIPKSANERQINYAHKALVFKYQRQHTNAGADSDEEIIQNIKEVNRIHQILTDKKKKAIYDEYGSYGIHVAEKYGEDNVHFQSVVTSLCCQAFGLVTCGYCCFCCFYCCDCCCGSCSNQRSIGNETEQESQILNLKLEY